MDNHPMQDVELAERLEAYAEARLTPSLSATSRMRARVMATAQRRVALARSDGDRAALATAVSRRQVVHAPRWRRPVAALLAASLTVAVGVGSVAAARPGGLLYGARIWAEALTLPTSAADRAAAEVRRLNDRLAEAAGATSAGDTNAATAALAAYNAILAEATAGTSGNAAANATLDTAVRHNVEVLTVLLDRVPEQARDAIEHAIEQTDSTVNRLRGQPGVDEPPSSNPGNGPAATNKPDHTANPHKTTSGPANATLKPAENATTPHPTPKPHPRLDPAAGTPAADNTPRAGGRPSPAGNENQGD